MNRMTIPTETDTAIKDALAEAADGLMQDYETLSGALGDDGASLLHQICHESRDGFIPFTNGGYDITIMSDLSCVSSSGAMPAAIV